jgi:IclR family KDG regulon transcriptional repressor
MSGAIKVIVKTFDIIEILNKHDSMTLKEITKESNLPKPTAYRILNTLKQLSFVEFDQSTQQHSLSPKFLAIANRVIRRSNIVDISKPYMIQLREEFGETVNLAKLIDKNMFFLNIVESIHQFRYVDTIGDRAPLHSTAIGKAVIAFLSDNELKEIFKEYTFTQFTKNTIINFSDLQHNLITIREVGISIDNEEGHEGVICIGIPLFDSSHKPIAAISVSIPKIRAKKALIEKIKKDLPKVGIKISLELGVSDIRKCLMHNK